MLFPLGASAQKGGKSLGLKTVCIDPGHGGQDPGTISRDASRSTEKDLVLKISKKLRDKIRAAYPDVRVIMTRESDKFVDLGYRADIANNAKADLFISVHINAVASYTTSSASGYSVHVLGQSSVKGRDLFKNNMELAKRENSVILLEDDYSTKYEGFDPNDPESYILFSLMQNSNLEQSLAFATEVDKAMKGGAIPYSRGISQDPFLVLWRTTMPSVLIECGFISNPNDLAQLRSDSGQDKIADAIFRGFASFKKNYDKSLNVPLNSPKAKPSTGAKASSSSASGAKAASSGSTVKAAPTGKVLYGTQVLASAKTMKEGDRFFKGHTPVSVHSGKLYKYVVETSSSLSEARKKFSALKKDFPDAYLVKIEGTKVTQVK